jgi:C4-dicarboxylate-specific signal transduction histidine kinase
MKKQNETFLSIDEGLCFFGKISAGVSHETNNVLAIINELAGLLDDLLYGAAQGRALDMEKIAGISKKIQTHVQRGEQIVKRMNRFAHSVDEPLSEFDVDTVVNDIVNMARRFASLKGVQLEMQSAASPVSLTGNRFLFLFLLFSAIDLFLSCSKRNSAITISTVYENPKILIQIENGEIDERENIDNNLAILKNLMHAMEGSVDLIKPREGHNSLLLIFPNTPSKSPNE